MYKQLTIFDWMRPEYPDIHDISEAEVAKIVGDAIGMTFKHDGERWCARIKNYLIDLEYDHYDLEDNHDLFLGIGYDNKKDHSGGGAPTDSIEEAIAYIKRRIKA